MVQVSHCEMSNRCEGFHHIEWGLDVYEPEGNELLS
jgi:hypothetical protein